MRSDMEFWGEVYREALTGELSQPTNLKKHGLPIACDSRPTPTLDLNLRIPQ